MGGNDVASDEPGRPGAPLERPALQARIEERLWRDARSVLLTGAPGSGKRTLAAEVAAAAEQTGRRVVRLVAAQGSTMIPYAALAPLLEGSETDDEHARFQAARQALTAGKALPLVVVPEIGLLDGRTLAVVAQLVATGEVRLLATESDPERERSVADHFDVAGLEPVAVPLLSDAELTELVRRSFDGPVDAKLVEDLVALSGGVPLHLRQLITSSLDEGIIQREGGWFVAAGGLPRSKPLERLISDELDRVAEQDVIDALAVAGQIGVAVLSRIVPEAHIDALERRELVQLSSSGRRLQVSFTRPLTAVVAEARLSTLRRRTMSASLADAIEATGARRREDRLQIASLRLRAGRQQEPDLLADAAAIALDDERCDLAVELARAAGGDQSDGPLAARLTLAEALSRQGHLDDADALLEGASVPPDDEESWFAAVLVTGQHRVWCRDTTATEAIEGLPPAPSPRADATVRAIAAGWALMGSDVATGEALLGQAEAARDDADERLLNQLRFGESLRACLRLEGERAIELATEGWAATEHATGSVADRNVAGFLVALGLGQLASGRRDDARATFGTGTTVAGQNGLPRGIAFFAANSVRLGHLDGRLDETIQLARRVTRLGDELGIVIPSQVGLALHALALATQGRAEEAAEVVATCAEPATPLLRFEVSRARAWVHAARGELGPAAEVLTAAADEAEAAGNAYLELMARLDLIRFGHGAAQAARTAALAEGSEGAFAPAVARAARAVADRDGRALLVAVDELAGLGATLVAAELTALAAELLRASGEAAAATAASLRCSRLRERCDAPASPAFARLAGDERLTDRERELAELAARGRSNAEIAGALHLSVRTVETHLQRAYRKLGVTRRKDLAEVLGVDEGASAADSPSISRR